MAKLDAVMLSVVALIFVFICLLIFNRKNTLASLVPLATIIVGFSFIFGHSAQTLFESVSLCVALCRIRRCSYRRSSSSSFPPMSLMSETL